MPTLLAPPLTVVAAPEAVFSLPPETVLARPIAKLPLPPEIVEWNALAYKPKKQMYVRGRVHNRTLRECALFSCMRKCACRACRACVRACVRALIRKRAALVTRTAGGVAL